jgi:hypothetical protein
MIVLNLEMKHYSAFLLQLFCGTVRGIVVITHVALFE